MQPHTKTAGRSAFIGAMHCAWLFVSMFSGICSAEPHAPAFIWLEAERPSKSDVPRVAWLAPANERERDVLSAGDWLTCALPAGRTGMAVYTLHAPTSSAYEVWARGFGIGPAVRWRIDADEWQAVPAGLRAVDSLPLDIVSGRYYTAAWHLLGTRTLTQGPHRLVLELASTGKPMALDCLALTAGPFHPRGRLQPGATYNRAPAGWFPFEPPRDAFAPSALDLSHLNCCPAGAHGRVAARGDDLVFEGSGEKLRAWGVTAGANAWCASHAEMDYLARRLAKMGVNMVRLHVAPFYETEPGPQTDGVQYFTAALKRNGIYVVINWYCLAVCRYQPQWQWSGFEAGERLFALHLFYPPLQQLYRRWAQVLFGSTNRYTGMTLAQDPAVAAIELIDEDHYLFWTMDPARMNTNALPLLEEKFGAWCAARHGSIDAALRAWGEGRKPALGIDDPSAGRLALYPASALGGADWQAATRNPKRASDQLRFFIDDMRAFYTGMQHWLRDTLGYRGLVIGTNWKTVDPRVLGPLDGYANMAVDVTARNTYFGGPHTMTQFHPWMVGDTYADCTLLRNPEQAVVMHMQYAGRPHFITEGGYTVPNRFRTEEQLVMAAYASLQGIDGLFPFVLETDWCLTLQKWPIQTPATFAQYPAAALMYRQGYIDEGPVVINEALALEDLYQFKGGALSQPFAHDSARAGELPPDVALDVAALTGVDPLAFLVGRVRQTIGESPGAPFIATNLAACINRAKKTVRSATGQIMLDYGRGLLTVNAPRAQGATGFLRDAGCLELDNLNIAMSNEYGAVMLVALDNMPLASSRRMLLQVMSEEQTYNWQTEPVRASFGRNEPAVDAKRITNIGTAPVIVRELSGTLELKRPDARRLRVQALDFNGYPHGAPSPATRINLAPRTLYYLISAPGH